MNIHNILLRTIKRIEEINGDTNPKLIYQLTCIGFTVDQYVVEIYVFEIMGWTPQL